jgi:hypothetical protein
MAPLPKCILLLIDDTRESLKPVKFLQRLYPDPTHISIIICYFPPPLPPLYQGASDSQAMNKKKSELLMSRTKEIRAVMERVRSEIVGTGLPVENIQEHIQDRSLTVAKHTCLLANVKKVDAVLVRKRTSSGLEGFLTDDPASFMIEHCRNSPVWLTSGDIDPSQAAICLLNEEASLRSADHTAFMLAETDTRITILHASKSISSPLSSHVVPYSTEIRRWLATDAGKEIEPFLSHSVEIVRRAGIGDERIHIILLPSRGKVRREILAYCREAGIGIVSLGHSDPGGTWGFLKRSITREIMNEFQDMAVWINQ